MGVVHGVLLVGRGSASGAGTKKPKIHTNTHNHINTQTIFSRTLVVLLRGPVDHGGEALRDDGPAVLPLLLLEHRLGRRLLLGRVKVDPVPASWCWCIIIKSLSSVVRWTRLLQAGPIH